MSIFPIIEDQALSDDVKKVFDEVIEKFSSVPVFYRLLASAPPLVEAFWLSYKKVILEGTLPAQVKELIFLAIARKRRCTYCASAHLAICDMFEADRQTLTAIMNGVAEFEPERIAALIGFCLLSLDDPNAVDNKDYQTLYALGITQTEVIEALYTVSYADSGVFLAKALKVDVDLEVIKYLHEHNLDIGFR